MKKTEPYQLEQRLRSEEILKDPLSDFTAAYFAVFHLQNLAEQATQAIAPETVAILENLMLSERFARQRQGLFFYRQIAQTLSALMRRAHCVRLADSAYQALLNVLRRTGGFAHRTAAEALGGLPLNIQPPAIEKQAIAEIQRIELKTLLKAQHFSSRLAPKCIGRSLVFEDQAQSRLLVVKLARKGDTPEELAWEPFWMKKLAALQPDFPAGQRLPSAIDWNGHQVFKLASALNVPNKPPDLHPQRYAVAFMAGADYFAYPNAWNRQGLPDGPTFLTIMRENARILGTFTAMGVIHSAVIPLFHNRVQANRRRDAGLYEWFRAGRLDRWLESCQYPNFGLSGLRDFEHFIVFDGAEKSLYRQIGNHILSLMLVCGSYFRNRDQSRRGFDADGNPMDARDLFDRELLRQLLQEIFAHYYRGFTGGDFSGHLPIDLDQLTSRMIDEMGVDRYMEELLRVADQSQMSAAEFSRFLLQRGFSQDAISRLEQGKADIVIHSGPHLGGFNQPISLPELIEAIETMTALCISGNFLNAGRRKSFPPEQLP